MSRITDHDQLGYQERTTTDFARFGYRERALAAALLNASIEQGFPEDFDDNGVTIMMNTDSGFVFFTNEDFAVAMMNGDRLESFYSCPECGAEGFAEDIHDGDTAEDLNAECVRYLRDIGVDEEDERIRGIVLDDEDE